MASMGGAAGCRLTAWGINLALLVLVSLSTHEQRGDLLASPLLDPRRHRLCCVHASAERALSGVFVL